MGIHCESFEIQKKAESRNVVYKFTPEYHILILQSLITVFIRSKITLPAGDRENILHFSRSFGIFHDREIIPCQGMKIHVNNYSLITQHVSNVSNHLNINLKSSGLYERGVGFRKNLSSQSSHECHKATNI